MSEWKDGIVLAREGAPQTLEVRVQFGQSSDCAVRALSVSCCACSLEPFKNQIINDTQELKIQSEVSDQFISCIVVVGKGMRQSHAARHDAASCCLALLAFRFRAFAFRSRRRPIKQNIGGWAPYF